MSVRRRHVVPVLILPLAAGLILVATAQTPTIRTARPAPVPKAFVGIVSEDAFSGDAAYRQRTVERLARLGIGTVRQTLDWAAIEPSQGEYRWRDYDEWVSVNAGQGIRVLPILFNAPDWASKRPAVGAKRGAYPPRSVGMFAAFAVRAAHRYGPGGSFWAAHPEVPYLPIRSWQIWNEPNLAVYWQPRPSARQYVALLRGAAAAIRSVDRQAKVVTAGLPQSRLGVPLDTYVRQLLAAGGARYFDFLAVNPYARSAKGVLAFLAHMRKVLDTAGARAKGLYATEFGWSSQPSPGRFQLGPKGQADAIHESMTLMWNARERLKLQGIVYFNYRDGAPYVGSRDFWGLHTGLLTDRESDKPALRSFSRAVATMR